MARKTFIIEQSLKNSDEEYAYKEQFIDYLNAKNRSACTVNTYSYQLDRFILYYTDLGLKLHDVNNRHIQDYIMKISEGCQNATVNHALSSIKSYFNYLHRYKITETNPASCIPSLKRKKPLPKFINQEDMDRLLDTPEFWGNTYNEKLARVIIMILYHTGMRCAELVGLNEEDIDFHMNTIKVTGKGNKQRLIPFGAELKEEMKKYRLEREKINIKNTRAFIVGDYGKRISSRKVEILVKQKLQLVSSQPHLTPHILRHTFATAMLNNGADLYKLSKLMGHSRITATTIYTHVAMKHMQDVYAMTFRR